MKKLIIAIVAVVLSALSGLSANAATIETVTEYSYDANLRLKCTAVRMNPATFADGPSDACTLKTQGAQGPDRITKAVYDAEGQMTEIWRAVGVVGTEQRYAAYTYSDNGLKTSETDARGNKTTLEYDGFDRLERLVYPHPLNVGQSNVDPATGDYEAFTYDANGNRLTFRRRDNRTISYQYDKLNREIYRDIPGSTDKDVYTVYDLQGRILSKSFVGYGNANGVFYSYDALGRVKSSTDKAGRVVAYRYNQASTRTRMTYPGNDYVSYALDDLNRLRTVSLNDTSTLFAQAYAQTGQRRKLSRGLSISDSEAPDACVAATHVTCYGYDSVGRLVSLRHDPAATDYDVEWTFQYNPAQQLINLGASTAAYDYRQTAAAQVNKTFDGLNRDNTIAAVAGGYDARGNLTSDNPRTFTYDVENRLLTATGAGPDLTLEYDAEGRLYKKTSGTDVTSFVYDGVNLIGEFEGESTTYRRRFVHGAGVDEPLVWFEGSGTGSPRYFWQNYQGSVVAWSNDQGAVQEVYKYGPYGEPKKRVNASNDTDSWSGAPFRYTGQVMLGDAHLYYYKARVYDPGYGRFLQTDPIGSDDDLNLYAYTAGDPINKGDSTGTEGKDGFQEFLSGMATGVSDSSEPYQMNVPESSSGRAGYILGHLGGGLFGIADTATTFLHPGTSVVRAEISTTTKVAERVGTAVPVTKVHGNKVDNRLATLYAKYDSEGKFLKWGVTKHENPNKRYTSRQINGGTVVRVARGTRREMLARERELVETKPGPDNKEPWAGLKEPGAEIVKKPRVD